MHYDHTIEQDKYDVRCHPYIVYKCSICGHEQWFDKVKNFDINRLRKCPKCGVEDDTSEVNYLMDKKIALEQVIQEKQAELVKITASLVKAQEAVNHETSQPQGVIS